MTTAAWEAAQEHEAAWWGNCANTYQEEKKQLDYARELGLLAEDVDGHWPVYRLNGRSVIDVGGGPVSILLKCIERSAAMVLDPCPYPEWVEARYRAANIILTPGRIEDSWGGKLFDEVWVYNVLQHLTDVKLAVERIKALAPVVRIFEWVEIPANETHPSVLHAAELHEWFGGGKTKLMPESEATAFIFTGRTDHAASS